MRKLWRGPLNVETESKMKEERVSGFQSVPILESWKSPERIRTCVETYTHTGRSKGHYKVSESL